VLSSAAKACWVLQSPTPATLTAPHVWTLQDFIEEEGNIALQKKRQDETNERKNAVEAYVYTLRNHLSDKLAQFVTESEQASISEKLNETEVGVADYIGAAHLRLLCNKVFLC
jgi:hypothetical protein